ncbi:MAG: hypothetical protein CVV27_00510 [Candidatus Melainabacteria bacterium HGW-Melainabacteria-1]|nr:MAG: hypothetical protein CVV27_00510 [Candidatus Melainabacteria bacterium HGW-Melainabacteria-1]
MKSARPQEPVVFLKPASSLLNSPCQLIYPALSQQLHHEVEVVVALGHDLRFASATEAAAGILGYGIGLDLTLRDRQAEAKAAGRPWAVAKGFAGSAPVSAFVPAAHIPDPNTLDFRLLVNGEERQLGNTRDMLFSIPELIVYLSSVFQLRRGDLIFTGTPAGVGPLMRGDRAEAWLSDRVSLKLELI